MKSSGNGFAHVRKILHRQTKIGTGPMLPLINETNIVGPSKVYCVKRTSYLQLLENILNVRRGILACGKSSGVDEYIEL